MTAAVELKLAKIRARGDVMTFGTGAAFSSAVGDLDVHNPCSYFNQYVMNYFVRRASERPLTFRRSRLCDSVVPAHESIR